jgi:hypothetical protein
LPSFDAMRGFHFDAQRGVLSDGAIRASRLQSKAIPGVLSVAHIRQRRREQRQCELLPIVLTLVKEAAQSLSKIT